MKIIGGARDYYDFAGIGIDEDIVLDRRNFGHDWMTETADLPHGCFFRRWETTDGSYVAIEPFLALVGGYGFPGLRVRQDLGWTVTARYFYDADEAFAFVAACLSDRSFLKPLRAEKAAYGMHVARGRRDLADLCIRHRFIAGLLVREADRSQRHNDEARVQFEPVLLKDIGLPEILPAEEAHMLISRFVGGVLPTGPETEEISDRSRIVKAGFDLKQSFRTRKGTHPARKRHADDVDETPAPL
ncbi:hypothetical protein LAZ40_11240 [Cereibacter sphaeroides]|uniref:hypothetical protein n=1 Tax=Cereibacter sphaeroides TaxID=1063 RepID=UPI001F48F6B2|nr:hypothetical protein [Cereibacter sphaeroides]MCE6959619.1 hypothetical protein [Cereibacter sphaeroides]MCE6974521.1 hypothetical protein [Cereibacter sphaeroides]